MGEDDGAARFKIKLVAFVLVAGGIATFVFSFLTGDWTGGGEALHESSAGIAPFLMTTGLSIGVYELWLKGFFRREVAQTLGEGVLPYLAPGVVLTEVLARAYAAKPNSRLQLVVENILGGNGKDYAGLTNSQETEVRFTLHDITEPRVQRFYPTAFDSRGTLRVDDERKWQQISVPTSGVGKRDATRGASPNDTELISSEFINAFKLLSAKADQYLVDASITYRFLDGLRSDWLRENDFIFVVTWDVRIRDQILTECNLPLFDMWYVIDKPAFDLSCALVAEHGDIDIEVDGDTFHLRGEMLAMQRESVKKLTAEQVQHLREFGRGIDGWDVDKYAVFKFCVKDLLSARFKGKYEIEMLRSKTPVVLPMGNQCCYWSSFYPSFVKRVEFDVGDFRVDSPNTEYLVVPFNMRPSDLPISYEQYKDKITVEPNCWMISGHAVFLAWRDGAEHKNVKSQDQPEPTA